MQPFLWESFVCAGCSNESVLQGIAIWPPAEQGHACETRDIDATGRLFSFSYDRFTSPSEPSSALSRAQEQRKAVKAQRRAGLSGKALLDDFGDDVADLVDMADGLGRQPGCARFRTTPSWAWASTGFGITQAMNSSCRTLCTSAELAPAALYRRPVLGRRSTVSHGG